MGTWNTVQPPGKRASPIDTTRPNPGQGQAGKGRRRSAPAARGRVPRGSGADLGDGNAPRRILRDRGRQRLRSGIPHRGEASVAVPAPEGAATAPPAEQEETAETGAALAGSVVSSRSRDAVTVCCREFPRTLVKRVRNTRSVLERAPGITRVEEVTATGAELCYRIHHDGSLEPINEWI